jgi:hypothetical protein
MADAFRIYIDESRFKGDVKRLTPGYVAMRRTLDNMGMGVVVVSGRKKLKGEKRKTIHGMHIANIMRKRGKDPFAYKTAYLSFVGNAVASEVEDALMKAYYTQREQTDMVKKMLLAFAEDMAKTAADNIKSGGLGRKKVQGNREAWLARMKMMTKPVGKRGAWVTDKYGMPPPYGIRSARFIGNAKNKGIRGVWKLGRRRR